MPSSPLLQSYCRRHAAEVLTGFEATALADAVFPGVLLACVAVTVVPKL
jgi:hypothetical protein